MMRRSRRRILAMFLALLALIVLALLAFQIGGQWFLTGGRLRRHLEVAVGGALKAHAKFRPLHFSDGTFISDGFVAHGKRRARFAELRASQVRAVINWRGLLDQSCEIDDLKIQNLEVELTKKSPLKESTAASTRSKPGHKTNHKPWRFDLRKAEVAQSSMWWGLTPGTAGSVTRTALTLRPNEGSWLLDAHGGTLAQAGFPTLAIDSAKLRYADTTLSLSEGMLREGDDRISINGEIHFDRGADFTARFDRVSILPLLPASWRQHLRGHIAGTARLHAALPRGDLQIDGELQLSDGEIAGVPLLKRIARLAHSDRLRRILLTRGSLSVTEKAGVIAVSNLLLESKGLMRLEGAGRIFGDRIDGALQLGVTMEILRLLPGAQARVFTSAHDGYYWTPLHLTGLVAHPEEDLTPRLVAAAAEELLRNPDKVLRGLLPP
jgi:hypothetical protein